MENNKPYVNINFFPLIAIAVILVVSIIIGSFWNKARTEIKLSKIQAHSEAIYKAHRDGFINAIKANNETDYKNFLGEVNLPERGIYDISILVRNDDGSFALQERGGKGILDAETNQKLNSTLSDKESVSMSENILPNAQGDDDLYAFTPIKDNGGSLLGFVVVSVRKYQNI